MHAADATKRLAYIHKDNSFNHKKTQKEKTFENITTFNLQIFFLLVCVKLCKNNQMNLSEYNC